MVSFSIKTVVAAISLLVPSIEGRLVGGFGDPHFKTWSEEKYDFHGECDLVLLKNPDFADGLGMDIHIRSKKYRQMWSYIETAAIRIGNDILEVVGGKEKKLFYVNGVKGDLSAVELKLSGYPVEVKQTSEKAREFSIPLGTDGEKIVIQSWNAMVRVDIANGSSDNFGSSLGLMGDYPSGNKVGRDGNSSIEDVNKFGQEWQVLQTEPNLFHEKGSVQAPSHCVIPSSADMRRRLAHASISVEEAQLACSRVNPEDFDTCVFDVIATNDKDSAGAY